MKIWFGADAAPLPPAGARLAASALNAFLGATPRWYKLAILSLLCGNGLLWLWWPAPLLAWLLLLEFIAVLASSLYCHPLLPGGLLALQILLLDLTTAAGVYAEIEAGFPVIFLVIFMVAGIHFLRDILLLLFSHILLWLAAPMRLMFTVSFATAVLSAFLDALTLMAILLTIAASLHETCRTIATRADSALLQHEMQDFLRGFLMHGAVATAYGGVTTLIGEPENLIIGTQMGWSFQTFFFEVAPASLPTFVAGLATCLLLEKCRWFGYGQPLPVAVREQLIAQTRMLVEDMSLGQSLRLAAQALIALLMALALIFHVAEIGLIGLAVFVLGACVNGVTDERRLGRAFEDGMPFAALLVVFFAVVAMIHQQQLFSPVIRWVLGFDGVEQILLLFLMNGLLSAISDNVFVAAIFIAESKQAFLQQALEAEQLARHAVAITMGTGIPSIATPNGQAAFLFLLTSALARRIGLGYRRMMWMALPYFVVLTLSALLALMHLP